MPARRPSFLPDHPVLRQASILLAAVAVCLILLPGFAGAGMIGSGLAPQVIATGDLNEDGWADLISGNNGDSTVTVSLGRGNGTFAPKVQYSNLSPPTDLAIADLNGDGHLDVAAALPGASRIRIRFGAGDGTLGAPTDVPLTSAPVALVATNFNNQTDAFMDLITVNNAPGTTSNFVRGTGGGAFSVVAFTSPWRSVDIATSDVDHDGSPDLVFANAADSVAIFRGTGTGAFWAPLQRYKVQGPPSSVAVADFDQDGNPDIVLAIPSTNSLNVLLGNGDGTFDPYISIPAGLNARYVAVGDFNGDNLPDVAVVTGGSGTVGVLIGTGTGSFQPKVDYTAGLSSQGVVAAALDNDPYMDIAVAASGQNSICTLPGNGNGTFQVPAGPVYVWNTTTGAMTDPNAWRPVRNTPTANDILVINRGGQFGMVGVGGSVAQVVISGGTNVSFSAIGFGTATLSITGGPGFDLWVEKSSTLNNSSFVSPVLINMAFATVAEIDGDVVLGSATPRFQAATNNSIIFQSTGRAFLESGVTTPFGDGTGASALNSVRFLYGSQCIADAPVNLFGTVAPNAVVVMGPGSRYVHKAAFAPDVSGRTYGDFEYNVPGVESVMSGSGAFTVDSLIVTSGTLTSTVTGPITIRGNIAMGCPPWESALRFLPASPTTIRLNGSARQYMRSNFDCNKTELFYMTPNVTLNIDNPAGVEFLYGFRTAANVSFTHGNITTPIVSGPGVVQQGLNRYRIVVDSTGTVTGAGQSSGWMACPLMRRVTADGLVRLDVGDASSYQPVDITPHGVTAPGYVLAATTNEDHWAVASAQLDLAHLAHRSWGLWATNDWLGSPATYLSSIDAVVRFAPGDLSPGADPLQFVARGFTYDGGWSNVAVGSRTPTSIELLGLTPTVNGLIELAQVGQSITPSLSVFSASGSEGNGPVAGRVQPTQAQAAGSLTFRVHLSQAAVVPITVDYQTVDGTATVADGDYTPASGILNFAVGDTAKDIVVPFGADATMEQNETFGLALSNASNATIATPAATGTILDDDDLIAPTATVTYPNGGELILQQQHVDLTWTATDNFAVNNVDLFIVRGAVAETLAIGYPNTGTYAWTASGTPSNKARFRVIAHDVNHATVDNSNANWELSSFTIGVGDAPVAFALPPIAPNPSTAGPTRITFAVPRESNVKLTVHDVQGRTVAKLADGMVKPGMQQRTWDASRAGAGVYFVRFEAPGFHAERRLVVVR